MGRKYFTFYYGLAAGLTSKNLPLPKMSDLMEFDCCHPQNWDCWEPPPGVGGTK